MSVRITDNTPRIKISTAQSASLFLRMFGDEVLRLSTPKTPKNLGNLRRDTRVKVLGLNGKIEWRKKYAAYQEVKQYANYTTPGTGPHFAEDSVKQALNKSDAIARKAKLI